MIDWIRHLWWPWRPEPEGHYAHPGLWLTRGDSSEHTVVFWIQQFDIKVIAPLFCRLGLHRWISVGARGEIDTSKWRTACWYCQKPKEPATT